MLRGKDYFGDFVKTIIIGFLCYVVGFLVILFKIIFLSKGISGQEIAIIYYIILMPIVILSIMGLYFCLLAVIRFFLKNKLLLKINQILKKM